MRALVTGVAGFIGSHLAERLVESGTSVVGIDGFTEYYDPELKRANIRGLARCEGFRLVEGSIRDVDLDRCLAEVDVVYHLAGQPGVRRSWGREFETYVNENVLATHRLLEAAREARIGRLILASSSSIYGDAQRLPTPETAATRPVSPYGVTKLAGEHLGRLFHSRFHVPIVILRYFTVYGPRQRPDMAFARFIQAAAAGEPVEVFGDGRQRRDFTYVDDAVGATIEAASAGRPGEAYNIAGGSQATVLEVIESLGELLGRDVSVRHLPPVLGDVRHTGACTEKAAATLGFVPGTELRGGLARQLAAQPGANLMAYAK